MGHFVNRSSPQQLIGYSSDNLVFSSIVKNTSFQIALLPEKVSAICQQYELPLLKFKSRSTCQSYEELCDKLYSFICEVSRQQVCDANVGDLLYLVKRGDHKMGDRILSVSRVEAIEYKILKDLRQTLFFFTKQMNEKTLREVEANAIQTKQKQIRTIIQTAGQFKDQLPHTIDFYIELAMISFKKFSERV